MAKIQSIQIAIARVPLDKVTSFATRTVKARDHALVKVRSEARAQSPAAHLAMAG
jgi:hypothetical protein